jgi:hypothetical protein
MKLLIDQDVSFKWSPPPGLPSSDLELELEYYRGLEQLAKQFSISGRFVIGPEGVEFSIHAQKVNLDEIAMNTLFADFLTELFIVETEYAALGGAGCEFALGVVTAVPRTALAPLVAG